MRKARLIRSLDPHPNRPRVGLERGRGQMEDRKRKRLENPPGSRGLADRGVHQPALLVRGGVMPRRGGVAGVEDGLGATGGRGTGSEPPV